jgi:CRP-like cAMP-binding protein
VLALFADDPHRSATVVALERSGTLSIAASEFHRLRRAHPEVEAIVRMLADQVRETSENAKDGDEQVAIPLSQEHLAGLAGAMRETFN